MSHFCRQRICLSRLYSVHSAIDAFDGRSAMRQRHTVKHEVNQPSKVWFSSRVLETTNLLSEHIWRLVRPYSALFSATGSSNHWFWMALMSASRAYSDVEEQHKQRHVWVWVAGVVSSGNPRILRCAVTPSRWRSRRKEISSLRVIENFNASLRNASSPQRSGFFANSTSPWRPKESSSTLRSLLGHWTWLCSMLLWKGPLHVGRGKSPELISHKIMHLMQRELHTLECNFELVDFRHDVQCTQQTSASSRFHPASFSGQCMQLFRGQRPWLTLLGRRGTGVAIARWFEHKLPHSVVASFRIWCRSVSHAICTALNCSSCFEERLKYAPISRNRLSKNPGAF